MMGFTKTLEPGDYGIGYKRIHIYDSSRTYFDSASNKAAFRPMQISVWYPTKQQGGSMRYADYVHSIATEENFDATSREDSLGAISKFKYTAQIFQAEEVIEDSLNSHLLKKVFAQFDPVRAGDKFPVVLNIPGMGTPTSGLGQPIENYLLFEYLASHGYVIVSCPIFNRREFTRAANSGYIQTKYDLEFLYAYLKELPYADENNVSTLGYSGGGFGQTLFYFEHPELKSNVSWEGGATIKSFYLDIKGHAEYRYVDPEKMKSPMLQLVSTPLWDGSWKDINGNPNFIFNQDFTDSLDADSYVVKFKAMGHRNFSADQILVTTLSMPDGSRVPINMEWPKTRIKDALEGYDFASLITLKFLDSYMKSQLNRNDWQALTSEYVNLAEIEIRY